MANMEQIKCAVGQGDRLSGLPPAGNTFTQLFASENLLWDVLFRSQWDLIAGGACSKASSNSGCETVAVPRFITTMPPA